MKSEILKQAILAAGEQPAALSLLRSLYEELGREIEARKPKCEMSGRCCRFEEFGHRLYVTGLELADFFQRLPPARANDDGQVPPVSSPAESVLPGQRSESTTIHESEGPIGRKPVPAGEDTGGTSLVKGCPFQKGKICSVHAIRPMGCRIFFCDPTAKEWMEDLYAKFHAKVKAIHGEFEIPYVYVEWREGLSLTFPIFRAL